MFSLADRARFLIFIFQMQIETPKWTERQKKKEWINMLAHVHDQICNCDQPLEHTAYTIFTEEPALRFNKETKNIIKKCLITDTEDHGDAAATTDDIIGPGDLDALFAEDFPEETG